MPKEIGKKGFAGLESMVSDIDVSVPPLPPVPHAAQQQDVPAESSPKPQAYPGPLSSASSSGKWWAIDGTSSSESGSENWWAADVKPSSPSGFGKWWVIGIGIVVAFIWVSGSGGKNSSNSPSYATAVPKVAPAPSANVPESSSGEEIPPVGSGLTFGRNQIRYCLSEEIRIEAWENEVNHYSESSVDAFNFAVNDYNARCSNFRYRSGSLESVRSEVEPNRHSLAAEGMRKALLNP